MGIETWNVRTLHQEGHLEHLIHELNRFDWEVIGLSETHWTDTGELKKDGFQILCAGNDTTHREGVNVFILNKQAQRALIGYAPISEIIISLRLHTQIGAATIQGYAPTSASTEDEADKLYDLLQQAINQIPTQDILIVMGDFNAKVGRDWKSWNGIIGKF